MKTISIRMTVNGVAVGPHQVPEGLSMNDYLREYLGLTGTKFGCGIGMCSACVVILDGGEGTSRTAHTCINEAEVFAGKAIRTIEGIAREGRLTPVQSAFLDHFAFQCGYARPASSMRRRYWSRASPASRCPRRRSRNASLPRWTGISAVAPVMSATMPPCAILSSLIRH
jgi:aerobic-type carbon monoxide dehydrogenase small subunit (CoxS/CutS family)